MSIKIRDLYKILADNTGKTAEEIKKLPPEEFARHIIAYIKTLDPQEKDKVLGEFYRNFAVAEKKKKPLALDKDFAKEFQCIKLEDGQYKIYKDLRIEKDLVLPKGIYNICPGQDIRAKDCSITIQSGTKFLLDNNTSIRFDGGQLSIAGSEKEKVEFIPAGKIMSARIDLENVVDAQLEHFMIRNLNHSYTYFQASNSSILIKFGEIRGNKTDFNISGGEVSIENTVFSGNTTKSNGGSILINDGAKVQLKKCRISDNKADWGGGIYADNNSTVIIDDCDIENNKAKQGGGIYASDGTVKIKNSRIRENTAEEEHGGGIEADDSKVTLDDNCVVKGNSKPQIHGESIKYNTSIIKDGNE